MTAWRLFPFLLLASPLAMALSAEDECLLAALKIAEPGDTVALLRARCASAARTVEAHPQPVIANDQVREDLKNRAIAVANSPAVSNRLEVEKHADRNPFALTAHQRNYFLPVSYSFHPNDAPYQATDSNEARRLDNTEAKFQLSVKIPLLEHLLHPEDRIYFGFTALSLWQVYNHDRSAPFRETDYEPEIFYQVPNDWTLGNWSNRVIQFGLLHESNGRSQPLSRSWNRIYANFVFENENWAVAFKPWYRIPEPAKDSPDSASGDDNPDIENYLGHFELYSAYKNGGHEFGIMLRNNLRADNKGAVQLDWTFPLFGHLRGYAQYFNGYGESLIDYDASIERVGVGFLLTDAL